MKYTIAICNYEMADTLYESLQSIIEQVDDRFEILVVDDGSDDGSVEILKSLERNHENFRLYKGHNNNLAEARNCSFEQASGEYIIESIDVDDKYRPVIQDFVRIYHAIESVKDEEFYLWGSSLNMAPRHLLLDYQYRSLGYGEDKDFWRRLLAADKMVLLDHESPCVSIGYDRGVIEMLKIWFETAVVDFQTGISVDSFVRHNMSEVIHSKTISRKESIFNLLSWPFAYLWSKNKQQYDPIQDYNKFGKLKQEIQAKMQTLRELEQEYGFSVNRDKLSKTGCDVFLPNEGVE